MKWIIAILVEAETTVDSHRERLLGIFKLLDQDKDGHVDINELGNMMTILDEETRSPQEFLDEADTNGDRLIEFEGKYSYCFPLKSYQFCKMIQK